MEPATKRRRKRRSVSNSPDVDKDKRRGRPRVEKQDESATDRRRTQIRLAQRAYRQRKESTLDELRKRVADLTNILELANKTFSDFRDEVASSGKSNLLPAIQEASIQFEAIMTTVRNPTASDLSFNIEPTEDSLPGTSYPGQVMERRRDVPQNTDSWLDKLALKQGPRPMSPTELGLGYKVVYGGNESSELTLRDLGASYSPVPQQQQAKSTMYNVLTGLFLDNIRMPQELPLVPTYSFQEKTFGRRLHRACLEAAYYMLLDPSRMPFTYEKVFRLSLMCKDKAKLATTIKNLLSRGTNQALDYWEAPLIHVGGAGTHYPRRDRLGNLQIRKSSYNLGLVGPQMLALLENAAKDNVSTDVTVDIAGYEGDWFDPYDVEGYLEEKGIIIDPSASFVEADINATRWNDTANLTFTGVGYSDTVTGDWAHFLGAGQSHSGLEYTTQSSSRTYRSSNSTDTSQNPMAGFPVDFAPLHSITRSSSGAARSSRRKKVTIDVSKLVKTLTISGVCLGRTPGYKRKDVDRALALASFEL